MNKNDTILEEIVALSLLDGAVFGGVGSEPSEVCTRILLFSDAASVDFCVCQKEPEVIV